MSDSGSGGTSVGEGPPWLWISIAAAVGLVAYIVIGGGKGSADRSEVAAKTVTETSPGANEAPATVVPEAPASPSALRPTESPTAVAESPPPSAGEPELGALLKALAGDDSLESMRAGQQIRKMEKHGEATDVLWKMMRTGDAASIRRARDFLDSWGVPLTFERKLAREPSRPKGNADWSEASMEVIGGEIVFSMSYWYGDDLVGGDKPPYVELTLRGAAAPENAVRKIVPIAGANQLREVLMTGAGPGTYECSVFMWGENRVTKTQHNVSGPTLSVTKP